MSDDKINYTARKYALQNAIQFNGKANLKAVSGKVISELIKEGFKPKDIISAVQKVVQNINRMKLENQIKELEKISPDLLIKKKKERDFSLPDLPDAKQGKVVTRFPPEPNGYLHIGHAKASFIDLEYARKYEGKFILRFDDTNPENAKYEFYEIQKEDLNWLGIEWDDEYRTSDNLEKHYKFAENLIKNGNAYVCKCSSDHIKECRYNGRECDCRGDTCENSIDLWNEMKYSSLEGAVLRLTGDMSCDNTAMRDPTLFRVIEKSHPIHGDKYRLWPTYDFAGAVEDSISGVTHPFRTKEYELRDECYYRLLDLLKIRKPHLMEFARLSINGMPVSKRKIKPLIEKKLVMGYDDIRLPTLKGLKKRGIHPDAIKQFVLSQGISKVESNVAFSIVEAFNRKLLDPITKRYFFVKKPKKLQVENAPRIKKDVRLHPNNERLGERKVETSNIFYIPFEDVEKLEVDEIFRLKDLYNVRIKNKNSIIKGEYVGKKLIQDKLKIQWTTDKFIKMNIFIPGLLFNNGDYNPDSLEELEGYAEESVANLKTDEIVQFERFGFVRIENKDGKIMGYYSHK